MLITADSLHSAWIPFEAGSFWTTDKPIIPMLGPGLRQNDLPGPLKNFLSIAIGDIDVEDKINSATNQIAEKLNLQQAFTKRRNFKLQRFLDALRAWHSQRPTTPDLQQEIEKLEARIQKLVKERDLAVEDSRSQLESKERSHSQELQDQAQENNLKIQQLEQELNKARDLTVDASRSQLEQVQESARSQKEQFEKELEEKDHEIMRLREKLVDQERSQKNIASVKHKSFKENLGNGIELEMIAIPSGTFMMGSPEGKGNNDEKPQHKVTVRSFYMGKYPITQAQYQQIMGTNPSKFQGDDQRPVEKVSWDDAIEFCQKLSKETETEYRLPTEAEWEYACRSVISHQLSVISEGLTLEIWNKKYHQPYYFGESITGKQVNYYKTVGKTTPVGKYPANDFGLYDMYGNVWEWCADDWHETYENAPTDGSAWLSELSSIKVMRGGSWALDPDSCRSAIRYNGTRVDRYFNLGLRVVCVAPRTT